MHPRACEMLYEAERALDSAQKHYDRVVAGIAATTHTFKVGDIVKVARKVAVDSRSRLCHWHLPMDREIGSVGAVSHIHEDGLVAVTGAGGYYFSPEALDLEHAA